MDDRIGMLERAMAATARVVRGVRPEQHDDPTPCPDWTVRTLQNHLVAGNRYFAASAGGEQADMALWAADHLGDGDAGAAYEATAKAALDAWRTPGALERRAKLPSGGSGPRVFDMHLMDTVVHGWDLATATGQDSPVDPDTAQALYDAWHGKFPDEVRAGGRVVGPEVDVAPDAPVTDRLLAYLGRTP